MQKITTQGSEEDQNENDEDDAGLLSEWRKQTHDRQYAINSSFREPLQRPARKTPRIRNG